MIENGNYQIAAGWPRENPLCGERKEEQKQRDNTTRIGNN
jgi:hypothetical protein